MTYDEVVAWIHSRLKFSIRPGLRRVEHLLGLLGNPERQLSMIHLAGTNGKGSTLAFTRSILMTAGLRVATFSSPYIVSYNERLSIDALPIPDEKLIALVERVRPLVEKMDENPALAGATEFEINTAMGFQYFAGEAVDVAIIEVGLGGLLDSTNVILPELTGITTIGLDHVDILGDTIEKIAAQKAGIIKPQVPLVTGNIVPEALAVIEQTAAEKKALVYEYGRDYRLTAYPDERFDYISGSVKYDNLAKSLRGRHQIENAGMAVQLSRLYTQQKGLGLTEAQIRKGLSTAFWPARMEQISQNPLVILDGAHNPHAVARLIENIRTEFASKHVEILFSAITTKDIRQMLQLLEATPNVSLTVTTFDYPKALNLQDFTDFKTAESWRDALSELKKSLKPDDILLVTGSLYFTSEVRQWLLVS